MFGIGPQEMIIVAVIGLLLFGKKLPDVARSLGKSMVEFKKGMAGVQEEFHGAMNSTNYSSTPSSRPMPRDERDEVTAPKFEPPKFEPVS